MRTAVSLTALLLRVSAMAAKFGLSIFLASFLGLDVLGTVGIIVGFAGVIPSLVRFGLISLISRDGVSGSVERFSLDVSHYSLLMCTVYTVLFLLSVPISLFTAFSFAPIYLFVIAMEHIVQDIYVLAISRDRFLRANMILASGSIWSIAFIASAYLFTDFRNINTLLLFWSVGIIPPLIVGGSISLLFVPRNISYCKLFKWISIRSHASFSFYVSQLTTNFCYYLDRFIVAIIFDIHTVGLYVFFWQISNAVYNLCNSSSIQLYMPIIVRNFDHNDFNSLRENIYSCMRLSMGYVAILSLIALVFTPFFHQDSFEFIDNYQFLIYILIFSQVIRLISDVVGLELLATRREHLLARSDILTLAVIAIVTTVASMIFRTPLAAAMALVLAYAATSAYRWRATRQNVKHVDSRYTTR